MKRQGQILFAHLKEFSGSNADPPMAAEVIAPTKENSHWLGSLSEPMHSQ
jgi:hypothetical protein